MLVKFKNYDDSRRVWLGIRREDGSTLELESAEVVELDLPEGFEDPYLRPVVVKGAAKKSAAKNVEPETPVDPAPIDHEEKPS